LLKIALMIVVPKATAAISSIYTSYICYQQECKNVEITSDTVIFLLWLYLAMALILYG